MDMVLVGDRPLAEAALLSFGETGLDSLKIDATRLTFACPLDLAGIVATAHWAAGCSMPVTLDLPHDQDIGSYLQRMDVLRQMPARTRIAGRVPADGRADLSEKLLEVTALSLRTADDLSERVLGPLVTAFYDEHGGTGAAAVIGACGELMDNAVDHGQSETGAFIAIQTYSGTTTDAPRFEMAVCDTGVGVMETLRQNPQYAHHTRDELAIAEAMRAGVSGIGAGRGNGLSDVIGKTRQHGRLDFQIRSGRGEVRVSGSASSTHTETPHSRPDQTSGTWAWLSHRMPKQE